MSKKKYHHELSAQFKGVSIGTNTASIKFSVDRDDEMTLEEADSLFSNSQLQATIVCDPNADKDVSGQKTFKGTGNRLNVVADVKGYRVSSKTFSSGLTFNKQETDVAVLSTYANRKGKILCTRVGESSGDANSEHGDE